MQVRILQLGTRVADHAILPGTSLQTALDDAGFGARTPGLDVRVNGAVADPRQLLQDGDVITLVPRIKGGAQGRFGQGTLYSNSHGSFGV